MVCLFHSWRIPLFPTATSRQCCFQKGATTLPQLKSTSIFCPDKYGDLQLKAAKAEQARQNSRGVWSGSHVGHSPSLKLNSNFAPEKLIVEIRSDPSFWDKLGTYFQGDLHGLEASMRTLNLSYVLIILCLLYRWWCKYYICLYTIYTQYIIKILRNTRDDNYGYVYSVHFLLSWYSASIYQFCDTPRHTNPIPARHSWPQLDNLRRTNNSTANF